MKYYLAIDIGASSGRHIVGHMDENNNLITSEEYRFPNGVRLVDNHLTWDVVAVFNEIKNGIKKCIEKYGKDLVSMSIDTWGVDYVLLNGDKEILPCYAYRDSRTREVIDEVHKIVPFEELYRHTGSQFQEFTSIYQFYHDKVNGRLDDATDYLMMPEYFAYKLTGVKMHEHTEASTTGLVDVHTLEFDKELIKKLGLKESLFTNTYKSGHFVGNFTKELQDELGGNIPVVLCCMHDTGSAVEGIPMETDAPYISSGTWSLLGIKTKECYANTKSMIANYSHEFGPDYIRFQKNIMGLWIIQNLVKQMDCDFIQIVEKARASSFSELYDVNDQCFLASKDMRNEIISWYERNNKPVPTTDNDVANATFRSLAYSYDVAIKELESITGKTYDDLYIVGGGAKNKYLNELTKEFTHKNVIALPIEATAIGNLLGQIKGDIY